MWGQANWLGGEKRVGLFVSDCSGYTPAHAHHLKDVCEWLCETRSRETRFSGEVMTEGEVYRTQPSRPQRIKTFIVVLKQHVGGD